MGIEAIDEVVKSLFPSTMRKFVQVMISSTAFVAHVGS